MCKESFGVCVLAVVCSLAGWSKGALIVVDGYPTSYWTTAAINIGDVYGNQHITGTDQAAQLGSDDSQTGADSGEAHVTDSVSTDGSTSLSLAEESITQAQVYGGSPLDHSVYADAETVYQGFFTLTDPSWIEIKGAIQTVASLPDGIHNETQVDFSVSNGYQFDQEEQNETVFFFSGAFDNIYYWPAGTYQFTLQSVSKSLAGDGPGFFQSGQEQLADQATTAFAATITVPEPRVGLFAIFATIACLISQRKRKGTSPSTLP